MVIARQRRASASPIAELLETNERMAAELEIAVAERDEALDALGALMTRAVDRRGFMPPEAQDAVRASLALLARHGRPV